MNQNIYFFFLLKLLGLGSGVKKINENTHFTYIIRGVRVKKGLSAPLLIYI